MNYSQKKITGFFTKLFGSLIKAVFVVLTAFVLCGGFSRPVADADFNEEAVSASYEESEQSREEPTASEDDLDDEQDEFTNPTTGVLTSSFGERWGRKHNGIDIGADTNTEIYAAKSGNVVYAGVMNGYGNYVKIEHNDGMETAYAHCNSISVSEGDYVEKGQVIAYVGSTGNSTGPHLHFEVKENGEFKNPLDYVVY